MGYMDVVPIRRYAGAEQYQHLRIYTHRTEPQGLQRMYAWPQSAQHSAIVIASLDDDGRLRISSGPFALWAGLAPATAQNIAFLDSAVPRELAHQTIEGLASRSTAVVVGTLHGVRPCQYSGHISLCAVVNVSRVLAGAPTLSTINITDPFIARADTTTARLMFLHTDGTDSYEVLGYHRGWSVIAKGRLPRFDNTSVDDASVRISRVWAQRAREEGR
jgi:hypothetical protein